MIDGAKHPYPTKYIGRGLAIDVAGVSPADAGILIQDIIELGPQ